jgi:hypothetical protein
MSAFTPNSRRWMRRIYVYTAFCNGPDEVKSPLLTLLSVVDAKAAAGGHVLSSPFSRERINRFRSRRCRGSRPLLRRSVNLLANRVHSLLRAEFVDFHLCSINLELQKDEDIPAGASCHGRYLAVAISAKFPR